MKQILCFGDSNTYGLIPGTTNQRYAWGTRWTSILDDKVRTKRLQSNRRRTLRKNHRIR